VNVLKQVGWPKNVIRWPKKGRLAGRAPILFPFMMILHRLSLGLLVLGSVARGVLAAGFQFSTISVPPDVLLTFRQTGGSSDLIVNIGKANRFYGATPGSRIPITEFTADQLSRAFPSLDGLSFSVLSAVRVGTDTNLPVQTIWVTRPRTEEAPEVQSDPWARRSSSQLGLAAARIATIGNTSATRGAGLPEGPTNSASVILLPTSDSPLSTEMGSGNLRGTFQGIVELTTSSTFVESGGVARSDFYELRPGTGLATHLGYFELTSTGGVAFVAAGGVLPPLGTPVIRGLVRSGSTNSIAFSSEAGGRYTLERAAGLGLAPSEWVPVAGPVTSTGGDMVLTDVIDQPGAFYRVRGQR